LLFVSHLDACTPKTAQTAHFAGTTYFDSLQQDASFITTTNDPAGFTLIDTFAWGALGHALGFAILAASSSGTIPGVSGP
jgi:photosystem I reaction center subunit V